MGKVQLNVYIDEDLRKRFYEFVRTKYERFHGAVSTEVQSAIAHWILQEGLAAHTNTRINPGMPRVQLKIEKVLQWLRDQGYINQFSVPDWEKAVINTVGGDARTVSKYLHLAKRIGKVKFYAGNVWEIV